MFLPFKSLHLYYSLLISLLKVSHLSVCLCLSVCLSLSPSDTVFCVNSFPFFYLFISFFFFFFLQCESHWVHIYNLAFHFMASGNGCFTAFIKACSSQLRVFPLKFSSMNLAIRGHYGPRFQGTVEHCIIWLVLLIKWNTAPFAPTSQPPLLLLFAISLLLSNASDAPFPLPPPLSCAPLHRLFYNTHTLAVKMTKGLTPSLLKTMIYHLFFFPLHNPHLSLTQPPHPLSLSSGHKSIEMKVP